MSRPSIEDIEEAFERIKPHIHHTPVLACAPIDERAGAKVVFKCENFQVAGAFKSRGACNAVFSLTDDEAQHGVATHSSGNHAAALARAAKLRGIPAYVVMPSNAPAIKQQSVREFGGQITFCEPNQTSREETARAVIESTGATMVHPYNDPHVIAGQGTAALEMLAQAPHLDVVMTPLGGGGLLSGTLIAVKERNSAIKVIGCEPAFADDGYRSWKAGRIMPVERTDTIADGLRSSLGSLTFPIISELVDDILLATEQQIVEALRLVLERMKIVIEPSSAVPLAALLAHRSAFAGQNVGIVLTGGNLDLAKLPFE